MKDWKTPALGAVLLLLLITFLATGRHRPGMEKTSLGSSGSTVVGVDDSSDSTSTDAIIAASSVRSLDGTTIPLKSYRGKWLLLNFWATWCGPCRMEMPALNAVWKTQHPAGLEMLGVTHQSPEEVWGFLNQLAGDSAIHYPMAIDPDGRLDQALQNESIPRTILVNPKGQVVYDRAGAQDQAMFLQALSDGGFHIR